VALSRFATVPRNRTGSAQPPAARAAASQRSWSTADALEQLNAGLAVPVAPAGSSMRTAARARLRVVMLERPLAVSFGVGEGHQRADLVRSIPGLIMAVVFTAG
jgi:hypothetical protein